MSVEISDRALFAGMETAIDRSVVMTTNTMSAILGAAVPVVLEDRVEAVARAFAGLAHPGWEWHRLSEGVRLACLAKARRVLGLPCTPDGEGSGDA